MLLFFVHWENLCSLSDPLCCVLVPVCYVHQGSLIDFLIWTVAFSSEIKGFSDYFLLIFVRLLKLTGKFSVIRWSRLFPLTVISSWRSISLPSHWFSVLLSWRCTNALWALSWQVGNDCYSEQYTKMWLHLVVIEQWNGTGLSAWYPHGYWQYSIWAVFMTTCFTSKITLV